MPAHHNAVFALFLLTTLTRAHAQPPRPEAEPRLTVVTTSAHCDWTWGHSRAWHAQRYAEIIRNVLLLMRQYPHYVWHVWQLETENEELAPFLEQARREWPGLRKKDPTNLGRPRIRIDSVLRRFVRSFNAQPKAPA